MRLLLAGVMYFLMTILLTTCSQSMKTSALLSSSNSNGENSTLNRLYDIWALEFLTGGLNLKEGLERPRLEINLSSMRINGTDGCNNFFGQISHVDELGKIAFSDIGTSRITCPDMELPIRFHKSLALVRQWKLEELNLTLLGKDGSELFRFKKVD